MYDEFLYSVHPHMETVQIDTHMLLHTSGRGKAAMGISISGVLIREAPAVCKTYL